MSDIEVLSLARKTAKSLKKSLKRRRRRADESSDDDESSSGGESDDNLDRGERGKSKTEEEVQLESLVFGAEFSDISSAATTRSGQKKIKTVDDEKKSELADNFVERKPAWIDDDDDAEKQMTRKTAAMFSKHFGTPIWADLDHEKNKKKKKKKKKTSLSTEQSSDEEEEEDESDENDDENMFQQTGNLLATKKSSSRAPIPANIIDIKASLDANFEEPQHARLKAVEFHPTAQVVLTGGLSQKLSLFQVDGKKNTKIQSLFIDKFPILSAHFTRTGDEIILSSRHKSFYYYDMLAGKMINVFPPVRAIDEHNQSRQLGSDFEISPDNRFLAFLGTYGQIHLFSVKSKEYVDSLKISGTCSSVAFSADSRYLFAFGDDNAVNVFDMNHRGYECMHKFNDYGSLNGTCLAVSPNSQFIATGCKSGVVNLYRLDECLFNKKERNPKPVKTFMNLTTPCTSIKFNRTSEILAIASSYAENACKLIHLSSLSVFSNFPSTPKPGGPSTQHQQQSSTSHPPIRIPECIDFSPNSGYLTIGNHKGNARLFRLKHYACY